MSGTPSSEPTPTTPPSQPEANPPVLVEHKPDGQYDRKPAPLTPPRKRFWFLGGGDSGQKQLPHEEEDGARMSFIDHLMELRSRLWISIITIVVCMVASLFCYDWLFQFLRGPLDDINLWYLKPENREAYDAARQALQLADGAKVVVITSTSMLSTMLMIMWLGLGAGLVVSAPVLVYEGWAFIAPGLKKNERRAIQPVLFGGIFFFLAGVALTYYLLFPVTLNFVVWLDVNLRVQPLYTVEDYMSLLLNMMWITGLVCEIPLVVAVLAKLSIVKPEYLTRYWRICVLAAFVLGAIFSPGTDVLSMLVFSLLLLSLYLLSVFMAWFFYPKQTVKT
ncbi:MAG TPA: twin-arginine translocase subunit TatC [Planctomycetota bacterium]|jgi:sec-independent protein translocase protein TatC